MNYKNHIQTIGLNSAIGKNIIGKKAGYEFIYKGDIGKKICTILKVYDSYEEYKLEEFQNEKDKTDMEMIFQNSVVKVLIKSPVYGDTIIANSEICITDNQISNKSIGTIETDSSLARTIMHHRKGDVVNYTVEELNINYTVEILEVYSNIEVFEETKKQKNLKFR